MLEQIAAPLSLVDPVLSTVEKVILALLCVAGWVLFFYFLAGKRAKIMHGGVDVNRADRISERVRRTLFDVLLQFKVIRTRPVVGLMHMTIFFGFLAFLLEKAYHFPKAFGVVWPDLVEDFYNLFLGKFLLVVSVVVLGAVLGFMFRRAVLRPATLTRTPDAWLILSFIGIIMATFLTPFLTTSLLAINISHWLQNITILVFLVYIPVSKHLHLLFCPANEFLKNFETGRVRKLDLENEEKEDFGIGTVKQFSWKDNLDSYTCIQCGRCNDSCPAMNAKKTLQPRELILGLQHAIEEGKTDQPAVETVISEKALWQCTTCAACENRCPVGIEHPSKIVGLRRYKVQADAVCPHEAQNLFHCLERNKNVFGTDQSERGKTLTEIGAPVFQKGMEYLLWTGCFASYDQGYRKSIAATIAILKKAGVSFGIMENEICCGDPARRMGNEFLFQEMAGKSIAKLQELGVTRIVTACPHCAVTLGRDWRDMGADFAVIHHAELISSLISSGKIKLDDKKRGTIAFHDPCYLSRYLHQTTQPRSALKAAGFSMVEAARHGDQSFCCGGGGGLVFLEDTEGERISRIRYAELKATGAQAVAIACPYCHTMIKDACAEAGDEQKVKLGDIAVFVQQAMV